MNSAARAKGGRQSRTLEIRIDAATFTRDSARYAAPVNKKDYVMRNVFKTAGALCIIATAATSATASTKAPAPRVSMAKARAMALKLAPGKIISSEYEKEGGIWRYSFDIQQRGNVQEIGIDGQTGKVVENKSEGKVDHD